MLSELEIRLKGSPSSHIIEELFTNSIHFPLANIILELLLVSGNPFSYLLKFDPYIIILACLIQAWVLGMWKYRGRSLRLWGNLIGPAIYTAVEVALEGSEFFDSPNHLAYWGFALAIGLLQEGRQQTSGGLKNFFILAEHVIRTNILLSTYWIFEASHGDPLSNPAYQSFIGFFSNHSHQYLGIVLLLLGLVIGFANITADRYLDMLRETTQTLRRYSEWFLGREILSQSMTDASVLTLQRRERTVMFMDIRGFTHWSETRHPEEVVAMLNAYFETAEQFLDDRDVIKVKHTGDEILAVFASADDGLHTVLQLRDTMTSFLRQHALSAGIGVHCGPLVEGLIGSRAVKAYDIIGDTVNTGKRICDQALGEEILLSQNCYDKLQTSVEIGEPRDIVAKGKQDALRVYPVLGFKESVG